MPVSFKSPAAASFICTDKVASSIINAIGKNNINKGIIAVDETALAIKSLEEIIKREEIKKKNDENFIPFSTRVYPLIKMLEKANSSNNFVLWEKL